MIYALEKFRPYNLGSKIVIYTDHTVLKSFPTTLRDLWSFLGHVGFYRRFIRDVAKVSKPLTTLLCKDKDFLIDKEGERAFEMLKLALTKHQFFKVLIGTYLSRSCATLQTMQLEQCWGSR